MHERYEIKVKGHLDQVWSAWFSGLELTHLPDNTTLLSGPLPDQAALHGLLERVRDLNLILISVNCHCQLRHDLEQEQNIMKSIKESVKRYSVLTYFALTFVLTWGCMALAVYPGGFPITEAQFETAGALVYVAMLVGPTLASVLLTGLLNGRAGLRDLFSGLIKWRVSARWYAVALLTAPLLIAAILSVLSLFSPEFRPAILASDSKTAVVLTAIVTGLAVGLFEELGWTGFAVPRMLTRYGVLATGLVVGIVWGAWHFLPFWESDTFSGALPLFLLILRLFFWLPPYRVLMVWVCDHTDSLLLAVLMHAALVAGLTIFVPADLSATTLMVWILCWSIVLWIIVAAGALLSAGPHLRESKQRRAA